MRSVLSGFPESGLQASRPGPRRGRATGRGREPVSGATGGPRAPPPLLSPCQWAVPFNLSWPQFPGPESGL